MNEVREKLDDLLQQLKTERDEARVRLNLARAEARDEWEALEKKWEHLRARVAAAGREAGESGDDVGAAARLLAEELSKAYRRVAGRL